MDAGSVGGDSAAQNNEHGQMVIAEDPEPLVDLLDDQTPTPPPGPGAMVVADDPPEAEDAATREPPAERGVASSASIDMTENPFLAMQQQAQSQPVSAEPDGTRLATSAPPTRGLPRGQSIDMTDGHWHAEPMGEYTDPQATKHKKKRSKRKSKKGHHHDKDDVGYEPKPGEPTFYDQQALKKPASRADDDASKLSHDYIQPFYRETDEDSEPEDEFMDEDGYYDDYHEGKYGVDGRIYQRVLSTTCVTRKVAHLLLFLFNVRFLFLMFSQTIIPMTTTNTGTMRMPTSMADTVMNHVAESVQD